MTSQSFVFSSSFASNAEAMNLLPVYVSLFFGITVLLSLFLFYKASNYSRKFLLIAIGWILIQSLISLTGFYLDEKTVPPRFPLLVLPPVLLIVSLFATKRGRKFIDQLNLKALTLLHIIRIPVEIVLYWLFIYKTVPQLMTFEGRNFDILSGISAMFIWYFGFIKKKLSRKALLIWNFIGIGFLLNIVFHAVFSVQTTFQLFAFDQPNTGVLYFPFVLLPGLLVPLVLFAHLASIRQLRNVNAIA